MNAWIVCYILRTKGIRENIDTHHYEPFIEDDAEEKSLKRFNNLCAGGEYNQKKVEVYSVNRCKVINSTEAIYLNIPL